MKKANVKFSVLMSIYHKENPDYLKLALDSVFNQTLKANEVVLVEDGKLLDELESVIVDYERQHKELRVIRFEKNRGLGLALNDGLNECKNEYVLRMDTDDICRKDRFEIQINYMISHPEIDVLGSNIYEFKESLNEKMRVKKMPSGSEINTYILKRNPINHMTVCFKKTSAIECGGYESLLYLEDYYLWVRMFKNGKKIDNINDELVYARIGNGFEKRRGNRKQIEGWKKLQAQMVNYKMISKRRSYINSVKMYMLVYCPNFIRKIIYNWFLRREKQ